MTPTEELVRELVDREAIRDLSDRYCDCLYRHDLDGLGFGQRLEQIRKRFE